MHLEILFRKRPLGTTRTWLQRTLQLLTRRGLTLRMWQPRTLLRRTRREGERTIPTQHQLRLWLYQRRMR